MTETNDPLASPPPGVLRDLADRRRVEPDGSAWFADDAGRPILDTARPGFPYADARTAAMWTLKHRPDVWGVDKPASETAPAVPSVTSTSTAADLMAAVRTGSMTADEATRRMLVARPAETRPAPGIPDAPTFAGDTMTALMAKAKAGDHSAIAAITAKYLNPNR
ncbi:hypothetical protein ACFZ8E_19170 [Methylobacterium sp. HMF5984]|uniref:hypothetical protein n=1 Tax=Methylobacterium sp. HMF5984 TaxID=3367370 RepID=UPI0038531645